MDYKWFWANWAPDNFDKFAKNLINIHIFREHQAKTTVHSGYTIQHLKWLQLKLCIIVILCLPFGEVYWRLLVPFQLTVKCSRWSEVYCQYYYWVLLEVIVGRQPPLNRNALHDQQTSTRLLISIITTLVIIVNQSPSHFQSDGPGPHCCSR